MKSSECVKI